MGNDADWTATQAGYYEPGGGPGRGSKKTYEAYQAAVAKHGVRSPEANKAINAAIKDGWTPDGITMEANGGRWPSGQSKSRGGKGGGGIPSFGKPVDQ